MHPVRPLGLPVAPFERLGLLKALLCLFGFYLTQLYKRGHISESR